MDDLQGTQGLGTTQLDDRVLRPRAFQRRHGEPRHVLKGNPADLVLARTVHLGFGVCRIEAQRGAQPHLGEERRLRSEERREGKECRRLCRSRGAPNHLKKKRKKKYTKKQEKKKEISDKEQHTL